MKIFKAIKKGFTLVELVIVIAVIAVLSAVLIPVFGNVVKDARVSALKASLKTCTNNLLMYSLNYQVDYYTPSVIREFLKSEGIKGLTSDDTEFCEDGYSIWYNQENFNLILVKNEEIVNYVNASSSTASVRSGNVATMTADIFGNVADGAVTGGVETSGASSKLGMLPRRPEAITADENLLLIATDAANSNILKGIEEIYCAADPGKNRKADEALLAVKQVIKNCEIFDYIGASWTVNNYLGEFDPNQTAWLNSSGYFYTDAESKGVEGDEIIEITNVIVSPNLGIELTEDDQQSFVDGIYNVSGGIRNFNGDERTVWLNISCTIEIASAANIQLTKNFYDSNFKKTPNILISGNVSLDSNVTGSANAGGTSSASTVTGGGGNISSAVGGSGGNSAVSGGSTGSKTTITMSPDEFLNWTTSSDGDGTTGQNVIRYGTSTKKSGDDNVTLVSVKKADGTYVTKELNEADAENFWKDNTDDDNQPVTYKYNTTSFSVDVNAFLTKTIIGNKTQSAKVSQGRALASILSSRLFEATGESVDFDKKVAKVEIEYNLARGDSVYSTIVYLTYYDAKGYQKKASFKFGVGYISSFDHYYRFGNGKYVLSNEDYSSCKNDASAKAGSVRIKLPSLAMTLQSYKNGYNVEVVYDEITRYYATEASDFGETFKRFVEDVKGSEKSKKIEFTSADLKGDFTIDFDEFNKVGSVNGSDCYINTVTIKRIIIKDSDKNILIVKYPISEEKGQESKI